MSSFSGAVWYARLNETSTRAITASADYTACALTRAARRLTRCSQQTLGRDNRRRAALVRAQAHCQNCQFLKGLASATQDHRCISVVLQDGNSVVSGGFEKKLRILDLNKLDAAPQASCSARAICKMCPITACVRNRSSLATTTQRFSTPLSLQVRSTIRALLNVDGSADSRAQTAR